MTEKQRTLASFALAALGGFILWYFSPFLFHTPQPGIGEGGLPPYLWSMGLLGAACRLAFKGDPKPTYFGVVVGQGLGAFAQAGSIAQFCVPCHLVSIMLLAMAAGIGSWIASYVR